MCTVAYVDVAEACADHATMLQVSQVGLEDHRWLCKFPESLKVHVWPQNPGEPVFGVARYFTKALGNGNLTQRLGHGRGREGV